MYGRPPYQQGLPYRGQQPRPMTPPPSGGVGPGTPGVGRGIAQFIESYRNERQAKKSEAQQQFAKHVQMMEAGIPVDKKKMAKWAREADLHFDLDSAPPPPPAQAPMMNNHQMAMPGAPQGAPMGMASPSVGQQAGAQYGLQQSLGGPSAAPAPAPQPAPPPGGLRGIIGKLGQAMGAPPPPDERQQMGVMKMLDEIQKRGGQNREMEAMQQQAKMAGLKAMQTIEQGLQMGLTMEDPRMAKALSTVYMLKGLQGGDMGALGKIAESGLAKKLFPKTLEGITKAEQEKQDKELTEKAVSAVISKHDNLTPSQIKSAFKGDFSPLEKAIGKDGVKKMADEAIELKDNFENEGAVSKYLTALYAGASFEELQPLIAAMGTTKSKREEGRSQKRVDIAKKQSQISSHNAATAEARLNLTQEEARRAERVASVAAEELTSAKGDVEKAKEALRGKLTGLDLFEALRMIGQTDKKTGGTTIIQQFGEGVGPG